jgi:hypothetical protein
MKKVSASIFAAFILFTGVFIYIGGTFDRQFWLAFLPGLMENLVILAVAVLIIDSIFKKERSGKLEQTNARQSQFVFFLCTRLAYLLLENLALATMEEVGKDKALNCEFALERFRLADLTAVFYRKLMEAQDKEALAEGFEKILMRETEGISKALDNIYPRPDPTIKQVADQMQFSIGSLGALKGMIGAFKAANAQVGADGQLKPEHLDLLIKIAYGRVGLELENIHKSIVTLSDSAKANKLFISLD